MNCTLYCYPYCTRTWKWLAYFLNKPSFSSFWIVPFSWALYCTMYCTLYCTLYGTLYCTIFFYNFKLYCTLYCKSYGTKMAYSFRKTTFLASSSMYCIRYCMLYTLMYTLIYNILYTLLYTIRRTDIQLSGWNGFFSKTNLPSALCIL